MLNDLFKEAWQTLNTAASAKEHPFKFCTLATIRKDASVKQRIVILRGVNENNNLLFYTDKRSNKINQLELNSAASGLFYDPETQLQLVLTGNIIVHTKDNLYKEHKNEIKGKAEDNYNSQLAPGTLIEDPTNVQRTDTLHFALLEFIPNKMEYLKLEKDSNHVRAQFELKQGTWKKTFLVP